VLAIELYGLGAVTGGGSLCKSLQKLARSGDSAEAVQTNELQGTAPGVIGAGEPLVTTVC
jgi:hypothetical protein